MRSWARVIRRKGWVLLGPPILTIAALFILLNHFFVEYMASILETEDMERRFQWVEQMKTLQPRFSEAHLLLNPQYQELVTRSFKTSSPATSIVQMELIIKRILQTLYFEEVEVKSVNPDRLAKDREGFLLLEVSFVGVPQQLNRLESALAVNEYAIRVNKLDVVVENNLVAGSGNLRIKAQFLALHFQPEVDPLVMKKSVFR